MNDDKKTGSGGKLGTIMTWVAVLYLAVWLFGWLVQRKWGVFLILTLLGTIGWAVPLCYIFYYTTDGDYGGTVMEIGALLGAITAICYMAVNGIIGKPIKKKRS